MNRLGLIRTSCTTLDSLILAACTQDEGTDGNGSLLSEGKYPLEIAGVTATAASGSEPWDAGPGHAPQTRVTENTDGNSSKWTDGDEIGVKIGEDGDAGAYMVNVDGSGKVSLTAKTPVYWASPGEATVSAWYPTTNEPLDLSDQRAGLKYAMTGSGTGTYANPVSLSFSHQLAKVCVELTGEAATKVTSIGVKGYTKCTVNNGQVSSSGTEIGYILMRRPVTDGNYWEANLAPQDINKDDFLQINGQAIAVTTEATKLVAGNSYVFTINVSDGSLQPVEGKFIVNAGDDVIIKNHKGNEPIIVSGEGKAKITIENVQLTAKGSVMTVEKGMSVDLKVVGTNNTFTSSEDGGGGIELKGNGAQGGGANITIVGDGQTASSLTVSALDGNSVGIGANGSGCGGINIQNIALKVTSSNRGPAIGVGNINDYFSQTCGDITITDSKVTAQSVEGACIGTGCLSSRGTMGDVHNIIVGTITITNSNIKANVSGGGWKQYSACIGAGYFENVKMMSCTIKGIVITSTTLDLNTGKDAYKVGTGDGESGYKVTITNGIKVGSTTAKIGWNSDADYR